MEAVNQIQLSSIPVNNQKPGNELTARMIPSEGLTTTKTLQNFTVSHHVDVNEFKGFEVSLDVAREAYSARDRNSRYPVDRMQAGDELTITLLKSTNGSQESPSLDEEHDFLCEFISQGGMKNVFKITMNDKNFAIAIPGSIFRGLNSWNSPLFETITNEKLKQLGLNVIPFQKIFLAKVYNATVPAIVMPLFSEIGGHIADHHNAADLNSFIDDIIVKNQITGDMFPVKEIPNEESFLGILQHAIQDAGVLVKNKIALSPSSINYQISDSGDVKLFFFDLPRVLHLDSQKANFCDLYANNMLISFYECMHSWKSLAFNPTTSNSQLVTALSALISRAAESESACSQNRNHPSNPSPRSSSFKQQT